LVSNCPDCSKEIVYEDASYCPFCGRPLKIDDKLQKLPWRRDEALFDEAGHLATIKRRYENYAIYGLGEQLANLGGIDLVFRSPNEYPDAILVDFENEKTLNVEFEEFSADFKGHDATKCDLIVCWVHNWKERFPNEKCPLSVYEVSGQEFKGKLHPKEE
jgi:hypothetical protein